MQGRKKQDTQNNPINFGYTKKMASALTELPLLCAIVGIMGSSAVGGCHGGDVPMRERVPLILFGLTGLIVTGAITLTGSVVTVPLDLAVNARERYSNYRESSFFKEAKKEQNLSEPSFSENRMVSKL